MVDRKITSKGNSLALNPSSCGWKAVFVTAHGEPVLGDGSSFGEAVAAGFALAEERVKKRRRLSIALALPSHCAIFERIELPSADDAELAAMVRLQFEKNLPYPAGQMACGYHRLASGNGDDHTTVLAYAVPEAVAGPLCVPLLERCIPDRVTLWPLHVAALGPEGKTVCGLWREERVLVFGIFENQRLGYVETFTDDADPMDALPGALLRAEVAGAPETFESVVVDPSFSEVAGALSLLLSAPVEILPERFALLGDENIADIAPPAWGRGREREAGKLRLWRKGLCALAVYMAAWVLAAGYIGIESTRLAAAQKEIAALQPRADAAIAREARCRALAPAVEPGRSGVELLFQTWQCLPSAETRITRLEVTPNELSVEGEAPNARQAIAFGERLKARPELADYQFESARPVLLPNEHAQFRISGKQ